MWASGSGFRWFKKCWPKNGGHPIAMHSYCLRGIWLVGNDLICMIHGIFDICFDLGTRERICHQNWLMGNCGESQIGQRYEKKNNWIIMLNKLWPNLSSSIKVTIIKYLFRIFFFFFGKNWLGHFHWATTDYVPFST